MIALFKYWQIGAGVVLDTLIASAPIYLYGKHEGRQQANAIAAQEVIKAYRERAITNGNIQNLDPVGLCVELGGMPGSCAIELRGLAEDHRQTGNSDLSGGQ
ncbi:hypothetical protein ACTJJ7_15645 [Phyllobacterium sp. 22229]|uniref:hypothetical protein n=1 Tax=Phyllobacterium sp. 22229 TaxID=3453895 RepID=UPI003F832024